MDGGSVRFTESAPGRAVGADTACGRSGARSACAHPTRSRTAHARRTRCVRPDGKRAAGGNSGTRSRDEYRMPAIRPRAIHNPACRRIPSGNSWASHPPDLSTQFDWGEVDGACGFPVRRRPRGACISRSVLDGGIRNSCPRPFRVRLRRATSPRGALLCRTEWVAASRALPTEDALRRAAGDAPNRAGAWPESGLQAGYVLPSRILPTKTASWQCGARLAQPHGRLPGHPPQNHGRRRPRAKEAPELSSMTVSLVNGEVRGEPWAPGCPLRAVRTPSGRPSARP